MKVLVVLGHRLNDDGSMSDILLDRLTATLNAWKGGEYDKIVLTGGVANPLAGRSEAQAMYEWLTANGVLPDALAIEDKSTTTKENAKFCRVLLESWNVNEVTLLSSSYHIDRPWLNPVRLFKRFAKVNVCATIKS